MLDLAWFDPASALTAFFALPRWTQVALAGMAALLVLMNSILATALLSRRTALRKVEDLTIDLADTQAKLSSETRWRLADERFRATLVEAPAMVADARISARPAA